MAEVTIEEYETLSTPVDTQEPTVESPKITLKQHIQRLVDHIEAWEKRSKTLAKILGDIADKTGIVKRTPHTFPAAFDAWLDKKDAKIAQLEGQLAAIKALLNNSQLTARN